MSRMKVLAVLAVLLVVGAAYAQQTMQPGQQQQQQQGWQRSSQGMGGSAGAWNSPQAVQNLSQAVEQSNADLQKAIETASSQAKGKAIGAAFTLHGQYTGGTPGQSAGQQSATGQGQNLVAHVYVVADNQLKDVIVDAKNDKVLTTETRQMVSNPWMSREGGMGAGGSSGQSGQSGMESGSQAQSGQQGQTLRERAGMSDISLLRLDTAQRILRGADQDNITLEKAISVAEGQAKGAKLVGLFLVLPQHANLGQQQQQQSTSGQQENVYAKAFAVEGSQLRVMTIDVKNNKVLNTETRSTFVSPWEGRFGQSGMGGSSGQQGQSGSQYRSGAGSSSGQQESGEQFPTGSGSGSGAGSLGGQ